MAAAVDTIPPEISSPDEGSPSIKDRLKQFDSMTQQADEKMSIEKKVKEEAARVCITEADNAISMTCSTCSSRCLFLSFPDKQKHDFCVLVQRRKEREDQLKKEEEERRAREFAIEDEKKRKENRAAFQSKFSAIFEKSPEQ